MSQVFEKVQEIVADALYVDKEEVVREASLMKDLGAESIDFLDIIFRLEKDFEIKIPKGDIEKKAKGSLTDDEYAINGVIQDKGLEQLRKAMPEVDASEIKQGLQIRDIPSLFTAATFERLVLDQLGGADKSAGVEPVAPQAAASNHGARL